MLNIYLIGEIYKPMLNVAYNQAIATIATNKYHNQKGM